MSHLHSDFRIGPQDMIVVTLSHQARVMLLNSTNYSAYRCGRRFRYRGGWYTQSPVRLVPPCQGHWHVVIDLAGRAGSVRAGIRLARCA